MMANRLLLFLRHHAVVSGWISKDHHQPSLILILLHCRPVDGAGRCSGAPNHRLKKQAQKIKPPKQNPGLHFTSCLLVAEHTFSALDSGIAKGMDLEQQNQIYS